MMAFALKPPSKAIITKGLEKTLEEKQREVDVLHAENVALRTREAVLLQQVHQQGDNLHFVALAASQVPPEDAPDMSKTLMLDLEVCCWVCCACHAACVFISCRRRGEISA